MWLSPDMRSLATKIAQFCFLGKNKQLSFYKVFTEIGSLGFTEFGRASKRTDISK